MGATAMTGKSKKTLKEKVQEEQLKNQKDFMTIHLKGDKNVLVDLKRKKIIPVLKPLKENILYAKRKL